VALNAGERLGPYEILSPLGAGGMGEVYRALDSKLGREVAIKVLPEEFSQHPQKLARFEREARLLAALNHPGIASIYSVEETEGKPFLVMELVEGQTLADRISHGPVPVDEALEISRQIAEALEAAHEKGVIHRDLKPANIKVDPEGKVKVLDFGLAKAFADEVPDSELSQSPTLSRDATRAGVILGTAAYMSPEQAKGKAVDKRSDIFSFGIVLFEMLTGKRAFAGEDVSEVLACIIKLEPDWKAVPPDIDPRIENLLRRCLRKDRKKRQQSAGDLRVEIEDIVADPIEATGQELLAASAPTRARERLGWGFAVVVSALVGAVVVWSLMRAEPRSPIRSLIALSPGVRLNTTRGIVLSPEGTNLVYAGVRDGDAELYLRPLDQLDGVAIRGTEYAIDPFFSPDGRWLAFFASGALRRVSVGGGPTVTIAEVQSSFGGTWGPDDSIVYAGDSGLYRVPANGETPSELTTLREVEGERGHRWPWFLPNGKAVLFSVQRQNEAVDDATIEAVFLETGERRVLVQGGTYPRYASSGHLIYAREGALFALPFDADRVEPTGESSPILAKVGVGNASGVALFAIAADGTLVYVPELAAQTVRRFVWVNRGGDEQPVSAEPRNYQEFTLSPDGSRVAVRVRDENSDDVWIYHLEQETSTRLTFDPAGERYPVWSPDGQKIAFGYVGGALPMSLKSADGTGELEKIMKEPLFQLPQAFSPEGNVLVFLDRSSTSQGRDLGTVSLGGDGVGVLLLNTEFEERNATLSPDGHWMAYESNESGQFEIYVRPFPDVNAGRWQVSNDGGTWPLWSRDGRELFYAGPQAMMSVSVQTEPTFTMGERDSLFSTAPYYSGPTLFYTNRRVAVSPDGQRFLMFREGGGSQGAAPPTEQTGIILVQNWLEELKRLVPTN